MENICSNGDHIKKITIVCLAENCKFKTICSRCIKNHDENHMKFFN